MFSFENFIDLPLIWGGIIATAIVLYVLLDGFDLGLGILFPFAPSDKCRDRLMNSIAPFWDGNETWLVLGGGGLFAAFPLAYAIIMPALYIPVILMNSIAPFWDGNETWLVLGGGGLFAAFPLAYAIIMPALYIPVIAMLLCLIFRGVAFEFRFKSNRSKFIWDHAFHFGSLGAAFMQGVILGGFVQGIEVEGRAFAGQGFEWLTAFSLMTGLAVTAGYILLGATWAIMKTDGDTQAWAIKAARYITIYVALFMGLVCLWVPFLDNDISARWFGPHFYFLLPIPLTTAALFFTLLRALTHQREYAPFLCTIGLFLLGFLGLGISLWPYNVPHSLTLHDTAAANTSLSLMLIGVAIMLPIILAYTAWCYYIFRGKASHEHTY